MASPSPEYVGHRLEVFIGVFCPLMLLLVALRFYSRTLTARPYSADDWLIVASLLGQFIQSGAALAGVKQGGIGYHVDYLAKTNPETITIFFQYLVFYSAWYFVTMTLPKLAICVLYRRLFPQRPVFIILCVTAAILIGTATGALIADLAACRPFEANWAPAEVQATHCLDKEPLFVWSNFPNIVTDAVMLILPLPIVWRLHTSFQLKIALTITFVIGSMGLVASILRFRTFANNNSFIDPTYTAVELLIWTIAEPGIYLISACLLVCRPLLEKFGRKVGGTSLNRGSRDRHGAGYYAGSSNLKNRRLGVQSLENGDTNGSDIALGSRTATTHGGFDHLPDDGSDERDHQHHLHQAQPQHHHHHHHHVPVYPVPAFQTAPNNIVVTTHINQSWDDARFEPAGNMAGPGGYR